MRPPSPTAAPVVRVELPAIGSSTAICVPPGRHDRSARLSSRIRSPSDHGETPGRRLCLLERRHPRLRSVGEQAREPFSSRGEAVLSRGEAVLSRGEAVLSRSKVVLSRGELVRSARDTLLSPSETTSPRCDLLRGRGDPLLSACEPTSPPCGPVPSLRESTSQASLARGSLHRPAMSLSTSAKSCCSPRGRVWWAREPSRSTRGRLRTLRGGRRPRRKSR
jgi:hypothetical protein